MRAYYQRLNDLVLAANAVLGAGAFMALLGGRGTLLAQIFIGIVAAGSALNTILSWGKKAKVHDELCRRFTGLAAKIAEWDATEANHKKACAERLKIEKRRKSA